MRVKNFMKKHWPILFLLLLIFLFFWKILFFPNYILYSKDSDILINFGFKNVLFQDSKKYGEIPLWNQYVMSGTPISGNIHSYSIFYPPNFLFFFIPTEVTLNFLFMFHFVLIVIAVYLLCRKIGLDNYSSLVSSFIFSFSGYVILNVAIGHIQFVETIAWIPLVFYSIERVVREKKIKYGIAGGTFLAFEFLSGHLQYFIYTVFVLFFYFLLRILFVEKNLKTIFKFSTLSTIFVLLLTFFLLVFVQLLPFLEFSNFSNRSGNVSYFFATRGSFPPFHLITLLVPEFFGSSYDGSYISAFYFWELTFYVGIFTLILALIAIFFRKNYYTIFFLALAIFSLLFSFGGYTPIFKFFYDYIPTFNSFRVPSRFLLFFVFSLSILGGFGFNFLVQNKQRKKLLTLVKFLIISIVIVVFSTIFIFLNKSSLESLIEKMIRQEYDSYVKAGLEVGPFSFFLVRIPIVYSHMLNGLIIFLVFLTASTFLLYFYIKNRIDIKWVLVLATLLIIFDLFFFGMKFINIENPNKIFAKTNAVKFIENDKSLYRVLAINNTIPQHIASMNGIQLVEGDTGILLEYHKKFLDIIGNRSFLIRDPLPLSNIYRPELLDLLNTKYIVTTNKIENERFDLLYSNGAFIYENRNFLPRAFVVHRAKVLINEDEIFTELKSDNFNPREYIIIEKQVPQKMLTNAGTLEEANVTYYSPNKIKVSVHLTDSGFLVLSEVWYPGWKAFDNGKEIEIYKTDYVLRSVYLEKGNHSVEFIYNPSHFFS